ncbi:Taurine catabolism dioxygenase TauD, TfdA family [Enhydrobacter aerosaccus]|uniref:Taurine catabolism dioxygenase TauD, TfdA family n=1 Tax=Enhydrobacter aerosaccus TaxID=225324 RepID=A0A1T4QI55_9HYPH|nr:TauD/TfdA family dioxygenase [Enhydrobacter aerosaccus]SKA03317.1 Taurine catabolism dioxygenase TauD, TfdA family [Enhydrobacter aerosaccus]
MPLSFELPPEQTGPAAWYGPEMARRDDWLMPLSPADVAEVEAAVEPLVAREADIASISKAEFPLPTLGPKLSRRIRDEVLNGRGFLLMRGLPVQRWTMRQSATAFYGLGTHLGSARSQNGKGHVLGHVRDLGLDVKDPNVRIYQTHERQTYHTDSCDIVSLLCLKTAKSGGLSALVSSTTIFNEMRRRRPDLLKLLFQPLATDRRGEVPEGQKPYFEIPVFNWHDGFLSAIYQRQYIDSAQRFPDAPRLTPQQVEALDMFDALTNDPKLHLFMEFRPGDVQFVHNHTLLHDRTAFEDWPEPERRRHLLRLWLAATDARPLPAVFAQRYGSVTVGDRGGIIVRGTRLQAPLDAV